MSTEIDDGYYSQSIEVRLLERANSARHEGGATALGDALHFEEAAKTINALLEALEEIVKTNQVREFTGDDKSDGYGCAGWVVRDGQYARLARAAIAKATTLTIQDQTQR
jgi:hypothetical protein